MDLNTIWFILIAVLYIGFFVLEGFDFGVGMLLPFLSRDNDPEAVDRKRRVLINTIGPHWDGNEVWLLTAGGATFAAFPEWYATMFSGFYLALFLLLLALIGRGVAFEFRFKATGNSRKIWDYAFHFGSLGAAFMQGMILGGFVQGIEVEGRNFAGAPLDWLSAFSVMTGLALVCGYALLGSTWLIMKTEDTTQDWARTRSGNATTRRLVDTSPHYWPFSTTSRNKAS